MKITRIGIDLGKSTFHVCATDRSGKVVLAKVFTRRALRQFMAGVEPSVVGLEACGGAHHWARLLCGMGHDARLMSPQFVKAYVKSNKNDFRDAEAICEAVSRPTMRFVPVKSVEQQDLQHLHRIPTASRCAKETTHAVCVQGIGGASMDHVSIIGIDISKRSFQLHGATAAGVPVLRRKLSRGKIIECLASQPPCLVVMETCGGAHHWGREIQQLGHEVRLIAPAYVKPFAKRRQKSDARDAAAIVEAAQRPTMRFVAVKTEQAQSRSMLYRTRALLVQQRTQTVNALRGHLAEFGLVAARGVANVEQLWQAFAERADTLPELVVPTAGLLFDRIAELTARIGELDKQMQSLVREQDDLRRLMTIPGVGEVSAMAVHAFAPPMESFARGRDFAAWVGLTPREVSTGGRQQLGRITKMGQRDLRRLLVLGAMAVIRHARRRKDIADPWLRRMLAEKPAKLVAVALANKMARIIWALMVRGESYRAPQQVVGAVAG